MYIDRDSIGIIPDNDEAYFSLLQAAIESVDELSGMTISRHPGSYSFRLSPSHPMYIDALVDSIIRMNTLFKIHVNFSKSMKSTCSIFLRYQLLNKNSLSLQKL